MKIMRLSRSSLAATSRMLDSFIAMRTPTSRVPGLLQALTTLSAIGKSGDIIPFQTAAFTPYLQIIVSSRSLMTVTTPSEIRSLLVPFVPIMDELIRIGYSKASINPSDMLADLSEVVTLTSRGAGYGTRTQQYPMFQELFSKFTNEIANAAASVGEIELEEAIRSNGLLDVSKIVNVFKLGKPMPHMYSVSKQLINEIMSKGYNFKKFPKYINQNVFHKFDFEEINKKFKYKIDNIGTLQAKSFFTGLLIWFIPIAFVYILGWSVGWVYRGFKKA